MPEKDTPASPYRELLPLTLTVMTGVLSTSFSAIFINIAIPDIMADFAVPQSQSHWLITAFVTMGTLTMLLSGWGANRFGVRNLFIINLVVFLAASLLGGFGQHILTLVTARVFQGAAMGFISVLALMGLYAAYPIEHRGRAGALFGLGMALAPTTGPTLSGIIIEIWGWRAIFFVPMAMALLSLFLSWRLLPRHEKTPTSSKPFDWLGFFLVVAFLITLFGGASWLQQRQWPPLLSIFTLLLLAVLLVWLVMIERRREHALLAVNLFRYPVFNASAWVALVYGVGLWGSGYLIALYLQDGVGLSAFVTGMVMLPSGLALCLLLPLGGRLIDTYPAHRVVTLGLVFSASAFLGLGFGSASTPLIVFAALITLSRGLGLGIMIPGLDATATRALPAALMNEGIATMNFLRQLGGAMSPTIIMLIYEWRLGVNNAASTETDLSAAMLSYQQTATGLGLIFLLAIFPAMKMRLSTAPA